MWSFFPFRKSEGQVLEEMDRLFSSLPTVEEVRRHLDRELTLKYNRKFELIKQAADEISRRTEAGAIDEESAKAAKSQMALQAAQAFRAEKAQALKSYEAGYRLFENRSWEAALQSFSAVLETFPLPSIHLAAACTAVRISPDHPAVSHFQDAIRSYRDLEGENRGLGNALTQAALFEWKKGTRAGTRPLLNEALLIFRSIQEREKASLIKAFLQLPP
jgi:hypothetical protein